MSDGDWEVLKEVILRTQTDDFPVFESADDDRSQRFPEEVRRVYCLHWRDIANVACVTYVVLRLSLFEHGKFKGY